MEANYVHKDSTTLVQDKLVKNELNQTELQYNTLKQQKFNELLKENQELKQKYLNAVSDYETTMSELQELKTKIENAIEYIKHYETIRGYYEYQECGYDEYNYEEDLKEELLDILKESGE